MSTMDAYKAELATYLRHFGTNVRRLRAAQSHGVSQEELAYRANLHRTEIGRLELGEVEPRLTTLVILADALEARVDDLLEGLWVPIERRPSPQSRRRLPKPQSKGNRH